MLCIVEVILTSCFEVYFSLQHVNVTLIFSHLKVEVTRDPSRLLMPTAGWSERLKEQGPSGGGQVFKMPHRAVPSWRQGLF